MPIPFDQTEQIRARTPAAAARQPASGANLPIFAVAGEGVNHENGLTPWAVRSISMKTQAWSR